MSALNMSFKFYRMQLKLLLFILMLLGAPILSIAAFGPNVVLAQNANERGVRVGPSGLALPRFVSLKSNQVLFEAAV